MERDTTKEVRRFVLFTFFSILSLQSLLGTTLSLSLEVMETSGEGTYYFMSDDDMASGLTKAMNIAISNAISSASNSSSSFSTPPNDNDIDHFSLKMRSLYDGIWLSHIKVPRITTIMDGISTIGATVKVYGQIKAPVLNPIDSQGRVFIESKNGKKTQDGETQLKIGDEFYFSFKARGNGFLAVFLVDEDDYVYKAAPIGKDYSKLQEIVAGKEQLLRHDYIKNIADLSHPNSKEASNHIVFVFSPNEFSLPYSDVSTSMEQTSGMELSEFLSWLKHNIEEDPNFTISWKTITIKR